HRAAGELVHGARCGGHGGHRRRLPVDGAAPPGRNRQPGGPAEQLTHLEGHRPTMTTTEPSAAPAEAPPITARRFFRRLFIITMTYAAVTVLAGMPTWFGLIPRGGELWQLTPYVLVTMVPASLLADYLAVRAFSRPVCDGL